MIYYSISISPEGEIISFSRANCLVPEDGNLRHEITDSNGKKHVGVFLHQAEASNLDFAVKRILGI
jgi:hypothetical protein